MNTVTTPDDYRVPHSAGAVEFAPDPVSGVEQIDLRASSLERLTHRTLELAIPAHEANPEDVDPRRMEFGNQALEAAFTVAQQELYDPTDTQLMLQYGTQIVDGWRAMEKAA